MIGKFIPVKHETGRIISSFVKKAASQLKSDYVLYYHDTPIWFIKTKENQSTVRRVQIASYLLFDIGEFLYFTPQLFLVDNTIIQTFKKIKSDHITRISLEKFYNLDELNLADLYNDFYKQLYVTWTIAHQYKPTEFDESIPRIKISSIKEKPEILYNPYKFNKIPMEQPVSISI